MTKPEDVPQDVWDAASTCLGFYDASPFGGITGQAVAKIARAIMEERSRQESLVNLLQKDRERMSQDWCDFCAMMGVEIDSHEAVALELGRRQSDG